MKKTLFYGSVLLSVLLLSGCGSDDKADGTVVTDGEASMSILQEGILELDVERGCVKAYVVHAVDGDGNPIQGLNVNANVIVNAKVARSTGTIQTTAPISFSDAGVSFSAAGVVPGDKLIVLPTTTRHHTSYIGDWDIYKVDGDRVELTGTAYNLETTDQLSYVVGNEAAYVSNYGMAVAHVEKSDLNGTTTTDNDGYAYFDVVYDPILGELGYQVTVGAHSGDGYRMGAAVVDRLDDCLGQDVPADDNTTN